METADKDGVPRRPLVAVIGDASLSPGDPKIAAARELGSLIIGRRWRLLTGGLGGVMQEASSGARASPAWQDGDIIGVIPGSDPAVANPYIDVVISTGMDHMRNSIVAHSDAIIVVGGGAGTLSEIALAWIYRRLIVSLPHEGWGAKLAGTRVDGRIRYKDIPDDCVRPASTPAQAIELVASFIHFYKRRHNGISKGYG